MVKKKKKGKIQLSMYGMIPLIKKKKKVLYMPRKILESSTRKCWPWLTLVIVTGG